MAQNTSTPAWTNGSAVRLGTRELNIIVERLSCSEKCCKCLGNSCPKISWGRCSAGLQSSGTNVRNGRAFISRSPRWPGFPCNWKQSHLQQWELYLSRTIAAKAVLGRPWDCYEYVWSGMDLAALWNCCITSLSSAGWLHSLAAFVRGCWGNLKAFRSLKWPCSAGLPLWRLSIALPSRGSGEDAIAAGMFWELMGTGSQGCACASPTSPHPPSSHSAAGCFEEFCIKRQVKGKTGVVLHPLTAPGDLWVLLFIFKVEVGVCPRKENWSCSFVRDIWHFLLCCSVLVSRAEIPGHLSVLVNCA